MINAVRGGEVVNGGASIELGRVSVIISEHNLFFVILWECVVRNIDPTQRSVIPGLQVYVQICARACL